RARVGARPGVGEPRSGGARRAFGAAPPVGPVRQGRRPADGLPRMSAVPDPAVGPLAVHLPSRHEAGRKLLLPYLTAGYGPEWPRLVEAVAAAGADAIEIGIPFSDPVMDGPTIQISSAAALAAGTTPGRVLDAVEELDAGVPLVAMT